MFLDLSSSYSGSKEGCHAAMAEKTDNTSSANSNPNQFIAPAADDTLELRLLKPQTGTSSSSKKTLGTKMGKNMQFAAMALLCLNS